ncbi:MAG: hypothetical protein HY260_21690, partial [Chloroflexi bacterium]|nr:hypothetical protein [Chloroflexota bacterium]
SLSLPAHWQRDPLATGVIVSASDPRSASFYKAGVSGYSRQIDPQNPLSADQLVDRRVNEQGGAVLAYQLISITPTKVAGADARAVEYAFVDRPIDQPFRAALPVVVHAVDYIIFTPSQYFVITFSADQAEFQNEQEQFQRILKSIRLP